MHVIFLGEILSFCQGYNRSVGLDSRKSSAPVCEGRLNIKTKIFSCWPREASERTINDHERQMWATDLRHTWADLTLTLLCDPITLSVIVFKTRLSVRRCENCKRSHGAWSHFHIKQLVRAEGEVLCILDLLTNPVHSVAYRLCSLYSSHLLK